MATFTFSSSLFPIEPGEDSETNPGLFGKALAAWMAKQFASIGYTIERQIAEDFGRLIQLRHPRFKLYVACCSVDGSVSRWSSFAFVEGAGLSSLFAGKEKAAVLQRTSADLEIILRREIGITDLDMEAA